jgi:hypothetical protein
MSLLLLLLLHSFRSRGRGFLLLLLLLLLRLRFRLLLLLLLLLEATISQRCHLVAVRGGCKGKGNSSRSGIKGRGRVLEGSSLPGCVLHFGVGAGLGVDSL